MVSQPTYLVNLKAYWRRRYDEDTDAVNTALDLAAESDRGSIILAATNLEDALEQAIADRLPNVAIDTNLRKTLFDGETGSIASFSKKASMAYALGIIDKDGYALITLIREIRNACAHSRQPISLETDELRTACEHAVPDLLPFMEDKTPAGVRTAFLAKCVLTAHYVLTEERYEGHALLDYLRQQQGTPSGTPRP